MGLQVPNASRGVSILFAVVCGAIAIAHVIFTRLCWATIPLQVDTGMWAYIGGRILDGALPYRDLWDQKPPGIFYLFAGLEWTFGRGEDRAFLWLDAIVTLAICWLTFALACRLAARPISHAVSRSVAAFATLLLCILLGHRTLADWGCNVEKFVVLFELAALLILVRESTHLRQTRSSLLAGLCCGLAGFFKQPAILLPLTITVVALWQRKRHRDPSFVAFPFHLPAFWLGVAIPWMPALAVLISAGILDDFLREVVIYDFRRVAGASTERGRLLSFEHWSAVWANLKLAAILLAPAVIALLYALTTRHRIRLPTDVAPSGGAAPAEFIRRIVAAQCVLTTVVFLIAPYGYGHYLLHTAPYAALIVACWFADLLGRRVTPVWSFASALALLASLAPQYDHSEFTFDSQSKFRVAYEQHAARQRAMVDLLRRESQADDPVTIWPPDQTVSYYAARRTPLEISNLPIIYKGKIDRLTPPIDAILQHLRADSPALIIDWTPVDVDRSATPPELLTPLDGSSLLEAPNDQHPMPTGRALSPLKRWLRENYAGRRSSEGFIVYRRGQPWRDWQEILLSPTPR